MFSRHRTLLSIACIFGIACLVGCSEEVTGDIRITASHTVDSSPVIGALTSTPTATPIPSPTATINPSPTFVPIPTLGAEEALAFIRQMQTTNGGCDLPCWWGITPGEMTRAQVDQILAPLDAYIIPYDDSFLLNFPDYSGIGIVVYGSDDEPLSSIRIDASYYGSDDSGRRFPFDESWHLYSLEGVLEQLGPPSKVWLGFGPLIQEETISFGELFVFYDGLGLVVEYTGVAERIDDAVQGCFDLDSLLGLRISIAPPRPEGISAPGWEWETDPQLLELVTDLNPEALYKSVQGADNICLKSPGNLWPFPDRSEE